MPTCATRLHAGARGYLLKDAEPDAIIRAIVAVNEGQAIFDPRHCRTGDRRDRRSTG